MSRSVIVFSLLLVSACASFKSDYEERLIRSLPNQREVSFSEEQIYPGQVLCGKYASFTSNSFIRETRSFIVTPTLVMRYPDKNSIAVFCSDEPAKSLNSTLGITPENDDWSELAELARDMALLIDGINAYYEDKYTLPANLELLLASDQGISEDTLIDPWGHPYFYRGGLSGRTTPQFDLLSYGADGEAGGDGAARDILHQELPLLRHVLSVLDIR